MERTSLIICERIEELFPLQEAHTLAFYYPFRHEVNVLPLLKKYIIQKKRIVLPKVLNSTTMAFFEIQNLEDTAPSAYGSYEPNATVPVNPEEIDWMFVPGVAFTEHCYRLGYGGGYYDRYLKNARIQTVGVAYDFQITNQFEPDAYDVPLDYVITESRRLQRQNGDDSSNRSRKTNPRKGLPDS